VFLDHFHKYAGEERPVVLLMDSVSSHLNMDIFSKAISLQIEIYRLIPNATHLVQPLDKGVFGPLKKQWYSTVRENTRTNPGVPITKKNFAAKLAETHLKFYKPSIIVGSFKGAGIFPVNRNAVSVCSLKPSLTFAASPIKDSAPGTSGTEKELDHDKSDGFQVSFDTYNTVISTPVRERYERREEEGYDVEGISPGYDVYKKLKRNLKKDVRNFECPRAETGNGPHEEQELSGLYVLADAAAHVGQIGCATTSSDVHSISPNLSSLLQPPKAKSQKRKFQRLANTLPDHVTSPATIRNMALNELKFAKQKAEKERKAKARFISKAQKKDHKSVADGKRTQQKRAKTLSSVETLCSVCMGSFEDEAANSINTTWIQCEQCKKWMHKD
jgi:hypothetical protein